MDFRSFIEMPIQVNLLGKWQDKDKQYRWDKPSIGILTSPVGVQKITQKWSKLPQQFNAWMLKGPGASKWIEVGEVTPEFITDKLKLKIVPNPQKPDEINIDPNAINVIYTQNMGVEKTPMNYWTIAHRFGHTIRRNNKTWDNLVSELNRDVLHLMQGVFNQQPTRSVYGYGFDPKGDRLMKQFASALGTMGSARKGVLRSFFEFSYELLAQYMLTGKVKFNRLPFKILDGYAWGRPQYSYPRIKPEDMEKWNDYISYMEEKYNNLLEEIVEGSVGHTYVM